MRTIFCFLLFAFSFARADRIQVLAVNTQKTFEFQRRQPENLAGGDLQFIDFVDMKSKKIIFSFASNWRNTQGGWSPDGLSAAINDHFVNSGDYLYVFHFIDGHLVMLRSPGDNSLSWQLHELYDHLHSTGRFTLTCHEWLDNHSFIARVTGAGYGDDQSFDVRVTIDSLWQFHVDPKTMKELY